MKRCQHCNVFYEDRFELCPTCGERLCQVDDRDDVGEGAAPFSHTESTGHRSDHRNSITFEETRGADVIINGAVAESSTQQYYQSKFSKFIRALFSGEPYQLSHTTLETVFRVEEHVEYGYPEQARDITLYGNAQNIFAVGDDVTVTARRVGERLIARKILNHSINSEVHVQPNIPAGVVRLFMFFAFLIVAVVIYKITAVDYAAVGSNIGKALLSCLYAILPTIIGIWVFWKILKGLFSNK